MKRNGEIELLRFVFAMIIVAFHFSTTFDLDVFVRGGFCVEFFFVVTGVLLGASIKKVSIEKKAIPEYAYGFMKNKISKFYPYYIMVVMVLHLILYRGIVVKDSLKDLVTVFLYNIPRLLFFDCAGFYPGHSLTIRADWYLSAMVLALFILVPMLLYNYEWASKIWFPIGGVLGLGVMYASYGSINAAWEMVNFTLTTELTRALFEIALGVWAYEIALKIRAFRFTKFTKMCLTALKWGGFLGVVMYAWGFLADQKNTIIFFVLCVIAVMLSFSENTYNIPYNPVVGFLGKISMLIYLCHMPIMGMCRVIFGADVETWKIAAAICACPFIAYLVMVVTDFVFSQLKKRKHLFIEI